MYVHLLCELLSLDPGYLGSGKLPPAVPLTPLASGMREGRTDRLRHTTYQLDVQIESLKKILTP